MIKSLLDELGALKADFRDLSRSYPKLFYGRLIAPLVPHDTWKKTLGDKQFLRYSDSPTADEYLSQSCIFADSASDNLMCRHALTQFDTLAYKAARLASKIPLQIRCLAGLSSPVYDGVLSWLEIVENLVSKSSLREHGAARNREQYKVLIDQQDSSKLCLFPALAYNTASASLPPIAFEHHWMSLLSPDVASLSEIAIQKLCDGLPNTSVDFTILTWNDSDGGSRTWTVYDPRSVESLKEQYGEPREVYEHKENGVYTALLVEQLNYLPSGSEFAHHYHQLIAQILNQLFTTELGGMKIERELNEGRKRIDICFNNMSSSGFFHDLHSLFKVKCPVIFVECKNYSSDPKNPEIDQLQGRFGQQRGDFGILVCRTVEDKNTLIQRCRDVVQAGRGYILTLDDDDLKQMWRWRRDARDSEIRTFLRERMNELIL